MRAVIGNRLLDQVIPPPIPVYSNSPRVPNPPEVLPLERSRLKLSWTGFALSMVTLLAKLTEREFNEEGSSVEPTCLKVGRSSKP